MPLLKLSDQELTSLSGRIRDGWFMAKSAHAERMERFQEAYRRFRCRVDHPAAGDEDASNVRMPLIQWQALSELSREGVGLFGDDAEVMAKPTGASDQRIVAKVARYMDWRLFDSMKVVNPFLEFIFRKIVYGRSFALAPWKREEYTVVDPDTGARKQALWYEGPDFIPLWPDQVIVPPESVHTIHEFSWTVITSRATWDELLRGEARGQYSEVRKNIDRIKAWAHSAGERAPMGDEIRKEADEAEGVTYSNAYASRGSLEVWTWYGYSEPDEKTGEKDEWVVTYLPDLHLVLGVQDLAELYPQSKNRRPIVEGALIPTGEYWGMGFAELLEIWEDELSANENLFTDACQFAVGPLIIAKPALGAQMRRTTYKPFTILDSEDPAGARVIQPTVDGNAYQLKQQSVLAIAERVTGLSDQAMGRAIDRPNAPRTAAGQAMLLKQGDVRMELNMIALREDMARILEHLWELECQFAKDGGQFFRVTEEDAGGLFDVQRGGAVMDRQEFAGRYDFDIKFATSNWDRAARKQDAIELFTLAIQNPIIATNPNALWGVTNELYKAFGNDHFGDMLPQPPHPDILHNPREEWTLMLQGEGESVHVNPADDDDAHLLDHGKRLDQAAESLAKGEPIDKDAVQLMIDHKVDHMQQKKQKLMLRAFTDALVQRVQQEQQSATAGGGAVVPGIGPIPQPVGPGPAMGAPPAPGMPPGVGEPPQVPEMEGVQQ